MQNSTSMPWQPPMSCQTCSKVHGTKKRAARKWQVCQHCWTWGPNLSRSCRSSRAETLNSSEGPAMSQLVTSNFWWVQSRADLDLEYSISDGSRAGFLISMVRWTLRLRVEECKKTSWRMALRSPGMKNCHKWDNSNGCTFSLRQVWTWNVWTLVALSFGT